MKTNISGYAIAKSRSTEQFFTSSSAYDRPTWVNLKEATLYETADLASNALKKLLKYGAYAASIRPIREAETLTVTVELPDTAQATVTQQPQDTEMRASASDAECCEVCGEMECECDDESTQSDPAPEPPTEDDYVSPLRVRESVEDENAPPVKDTTSVNAVEMPPTFNTASGEKVKLPPSIVSQLEATIKELKATIDAPTAGQTEIENKNLRLTAIDAFDGLLKLLHDPSTSNVKRAQLEVASWRDSVVDLLPPDVVRFALTGGTPQSTLASEFQKLWDKKRKEQLL